MMYYFMYDGELCGTPDAKLAQELATDITQIEEAQPHIDLGGSLANGMGISRVINYTFYSHHLTAIVAALRAGLSSAHPYVKLDSTTCTHLLRAEVAQAMLNELRATWGHFIAAERANLEAWESACSVLQGSTAEKPSRSDLS